MSSPPSFDPFQPSDPTSLSRNSALPPSFPVKKAGFSRGIRLIIGSALVILLSLGTWIGLQFFFHSPPLTTYTLPAIPAPAGGMAPILTPGTVPTGTATPPPLATAAIPLLITEDPLIMRADELFADGASAEAWESIARSGRLRDRPFAKRLMRFGLVAGRVDETLVILDSINAETSNWSEEEWHLSIQLHEATGQLDRAIEIAGHHLSDRSGILRLHARKAKEAGRFPEAISHQEQYLAGLRDPSPLDWRALAELYQSAGRTSDAARANRQAEEAGAPPPGVP
jgi:hypothetical protein